MNRKKYIADRVENEYSAEKASDNAADKAADKAAEKILLKKECRKQSAEKRSAEKRSAEKQPVVKKRDCKKETAGRGIGVMKEFLCGNKTPGRKKIQSRGAHGKKKMSGRVPAALLMFILVPVLILSLSGCGGKGSDEEGETSGKNADKILGDVKKMEQKMADKGKEGENDSKNTSDNFSKNASSWIGFYKAEDGRTIRIEMADGKLLNAEIYCYSEDGWHTFKGELKFTDGQGTMATFSSPDTGNDEVTGFELTKDGILVTVVPAGGWFAGEYFRVNEDEMGQENGGGGSGEDSGQDGSGHRALLNGYWELDFAMNEDGEIYPTEENGVISSVSVDSSGAGMVGFYYRNANGEEISLTGMPLTIDENTGLYDGYPGESWSAEFDTENAEEAVLRSGVSRVEMYASVWENKLSVIWMEYLPSKEYPELTTAVYSRTE